MAAVCAHMRRCCEQVRQFREGLMAAVCAHVRRCCEQVRQFTEEALSCGLHPSGHLLAVGFQDRLRLFAILLDSLKCGFFACASTLCVH